MSSSQKPPYPPRGAGLGGIPTKSIDIPISAVLLALFIVSAAVHMTIFQLNKRRGHKFVLSALCFGFSMARIVANTLRIVWAVHPTNARIAIAASIFANAGVVLLFVINLILSQRLLRAYHPHIGWSLPGKIVFRFLFSSVGASLIMVIVAVVYSFYTLNPNSLAKIRDIQLFAVTFLAVLAFLPIPIVAFCLLWPRRGVTDAFGSGSMRTKIIALIFTAALLTLGAGFRAGVAFQKRPATDPAWFHHKACFYTFNYVIELIVVFTYAFIRFDLRFHVPNGSNAPGHYSRGVAAEKIASLGHHTSIDEEAGVRYSMALSST